jgi:DNA-binding MarR family transcriptional regulator
VARDRDGQDRRVVVHRLTGEGLKLVNSLDRPILDLHRGTMRGVAPGKLETLIAVLEEIRIEG